MKVDKLCRWPLLTKFFKNWARLDFLQPKTAQKQPKFNNLIQFDNESYFWGTGWLFTQLSYYLLTIPDSKLWFEAKFRLCWLIFRPLKTQYFCFGPCLGALKFGTPLWKFSKIGSMLPKLCEFHLTTQKQPFAPIILKLFAQKICFWGNLKILAIFL